ncbi:MAG: hypothetical protein EKK55_16305 [Rhodocyclaceae bacterium]|nr:MAG: hypothetical protein EKK55_16305 [Rhodocyclaceae bacterium]
MNAVAYDCPDFTQEDRLAHILGQLWGGRVEPVLDPALCYAFPTLTPFQVSYTEWGIDPASPDRCAVYGGIGCGKTFGIALLAYVVAMTRPGSYSLITTDSFENLRDLLLPECRRAFGGHEVGGHVFCEPAAVWHDSARLWTFRNGSTVKLRFYDLKSTQNEAQNPIEGRTVTGVLQADEAQKLPPKLIDHAEERTRGSTRDPLGNEHAPKLALLGRPGAIDWWKRAVKARGGVVMEPKTRDNPHNGPRYLAKLREGRTPAQFHCIIGEGPAPVEGAAYEGFKTVAEDGGPAYWPHGNLIRAAVCSGPGAVTLALDPGYGNPAVLFVRQVRLLLGPPWRAREITAHVVLDDLGGGLEETTTPHLIQAIQRRLDLRGWTARTLIADPAGAATNAHTGQSDLALFARPRTALAHGDHLGPGLGVRVITPTEKPKRDVLLGVSRVQALICNADEPPLRLLLTTDEHWQRCEAAGTEVRSFRNSLLQYTIDIARKKSGTGRDHPSTHHADALRYYVAEGPGTWQMSGGGAPPPATTPTAAELDWARFTSEDR